MQNAKKSGRTTFETSSSGTRSIDTDTKGSDLCDAVLVSEQLEHKPDGGPEGQGQEGSGGDASARTGALVAREPPKSRFGARGSPRTGECDRGHSGDRNIASRTAHGDGFGSRLVRHPRRKKTMPLCANPAGNSGIVLPFCGDALVQKIYTNQCCKTAVSHPCRGPPAQSQQVGRVGATPACKGRRQEKRASCVVVDLVGAAFRAVAIMARWCVFRPPIG